MPTASVTLDGLAHEVARRRTFAIISHPDAGKTTLTEKLLLYSGAVELAGAVKAKGNQRRATSDWMAMEQERGISITTTALQFDYQDHQFNLLDTPGHQDFSEDTYRTLMAVDSAVMVIDAAKGIEPQTRKLFEVCRSRHIPILTFINKMDHPGQEPLQLLDEIEKVLGIGAAPRNWPIGTGAGFQGVYDLEQRQVLRFERTVRGARQAPVTVRDIDDPALSDMIGETAYQRLREDVELLDIAGAPFEADRFLVGEVTPVYFGSALNNFGVDPFLSALLNLAPPPAARISNCGPVPPTREEFSGCVFKIQANLDPQHRDRVAFLRVCSGRFEKDMVVHHTRLGRKVRLARPYRIFGRDREVMEEAYPGDVVGLVNPGLFAIGDTLCTGDPISFAPMPQFQPEFFAVLRNVDSSRYKQFNKGLEQLHEEGAIQVLYATDAMRREPILSAVGELQFDVVLGRLRSEYGVDARLERLPYECARWIDGDPEAVTKVNWPRGSLQTKDAHDRLVVLFATDWDPKYCAEKNPDITLKERG